MSEENKPTPQSEADKEKEGWGHVERLRSGGLKGDNAPDDVGRRRSGL